MPPSLLLANLALGAAVAIVVWSLLLLLLAREPQAETFLCECCDELCPKSELFVANDSEGHTWCRACIRDEGLDDDEGEAA